MWVTAAFLGVVSFAHHEAKRPEDAWPLRPTSNWDLDWLKMSDGKHALWYSTDPLPANSLIARLAPLYESSLQLAPPSEIALQDLPGGLVRLLRLDDPSTMDSNPYHSAACALAGLLKIECNHSTIANFLDFSSHLSPEHKCLLRQKDPRALLLLTYWYAKICRYHQWWIWGRSMLECQAVCIYLERFHADETEIHDLLQFPKAMCGLGTGSSKSWQDRQSYLFDEATVTEILA